MFPAELPGDIATQRRSSFYGGAMPITSNIGNFTLGAYCSAALTCDQYKLR